ncbi:hypothetical protein GXB85_08500 [Cellulomonas sp. APG4]|uniref:hypothetical protein n=1 Tax=Cellulomonas sp. APG4 TaxID=1538656 RepID=UPI00137B3243|nr:hypothetical protein [Cellulomonas sp. APG4]NCT90984.1 hypothetical protein [Cellulomonas sp. APG4]
MTEGLAGLDAHHDASSDALDQRERLRPWIGVGLRFGTVLFLALGLLGLAGEWAFGLDGPGFTPMGIVAAATGALAYVVVNAARERRAEGRPPRALGGEVLGVVAVCAAGVVVLLLAGGLEPVRVPLWSVLAPLAVGVACALVGRRFASPDA